MIAVVGTDYVLSVEPGYIQTLGLRHDDPLWNAQIDAFESTLLAVVSAGVQLTAEQLKEITEAVLDALENQDE